MKQCLWVVEIQDGEDWWRAYVGAKWAHDTEEKAQFWADSLASGPEAPKTRVAKYVREEKP